MYTSVNDYNPNPKNKGIDGKLECSSYIRYLS